MALSSTHHLRILCFGASITAGFHSFGLRFHPYASQLKARLQESSPQSRIDIDVDGLSGDRVVEGQYLSRIEPRCNSSKNARYDWIIVQGGGNDLGWGKDPQVIFEELNKIWRIALDAGAKVLALTVTETSNPGKIMKAKYDALNAMILKHEEDGYHVADLCSAIPYESMDEARRKKIWDDGLHFKEAGYDMMGDVIADRLLEILQPNPQPKI